MCMAATGCGSGTSQSTRDAAGVCTPDPDPPSMGIPMGRLGDTARERELEREWVRTTVGIWWELNAGCVCESLLCAWVLLLPPLKVPSAWTVGLPSLPTESFVVPNAGQCMACSGSTRLLRGSHCQLHVMDVSCHCMLCCVAHKTKCTGATEKL